MGWGPLTAAARVWHVSTATTTSEAPRCLFLPHPHRRQVSEIVVLIPAIVVGEQALHFFSGALVWREKNNRPFPLSALYGLGQVHFLRGSWSTSEQILLTLLWLNPHDEPLAGALLAKVRRAAGLPAHGGARTARLSPSPARPVQRPCS